MQATSSVSGRSGAVTIGLAGAATVRASADQLAGLRKAPPLPKGTILSSGFLKNSDDQTVMALAAISRAMDAIDRPPGAFEDWGVLAAANLFGRSGTFQSLLNFRKEGAWGVTPHVIPHHSLHAVSGTMSQALQMHGPNFGIGGGPNAVAEAFLAAATLISENNVPGLWVVFTGHDRESFPQTANQDSQAQPACLAAVIALEPPTADHGSFVYVCGANKVPADWPQMDLGGFMGALESSVPGGRWSLPGGGWVILGGTGEAPP